MRELAGAFEDWSIKAPELGSILGCEDRFGRVLIVVEGLMIVENPDDMPNATLDLSNTLVSEEAEASRSEASRAVLEGGL